MDSLHVDKTINHFSDDFDSKKFAKQFKVFKDEMQRVFGISIYLFLIVLTIRILYEVWTRTNTLFT